MDNVISLTGKPVAQTGVDESRAAILEFLDEARKAVEAGDIESITGIMLHKAAVWSSRNCG